MLEDNQDLSSSSASSFRDSPQCRICLGDDIKNLNNPIIIPCKCSGTVRYIHLNCLKAWIKQRVEVKETPHATSIMWKSLNCELCKSPYPFAVYFNGKIHELLTFKLPNPPYIIFEHFSKDENNCCGIYIAGFSIKQELKIGRNNENDIRLNDVSVSRYHSKICLHEKDVYIEDTNSKFGTLILLRKPKILIPGEHYIIQSANSVLDFFVLQSWSFLSCLGFGPKINRKELDVEESKTLPTCVLPGNGKHSVLVVKKKSYEKLLIHEERMKKEGLNKTMCCSGGGILKGHLVFERESIPSAQFFRQKTTAHPTTKNKAKKFENHLDSFNQILHLRGDTADDVNYEDCE